MKLFYICKDHESIAVVIPKDVYKELGWAAGDEVHIESGKLEGIPNKVLIIQKESKV